MKHHLEDAIFHLKNAERSLEAAVDEASNHPQYTHLQMLAATTRKMMKALRVQLRKRNGK